MRAVFASIQEVYDNGVTIRVRSVVRHVQYNNTMQTLLTTSSEVLSRGNITNLI